MIKTALSNFCHKLGIAPCELTGKSQKQPLPLYRAVFSYIMYPAYSQSKIARLLNRKPSTINNSVHRLREALEVRDKSVMQIFDKINNKINKARMDRPEFNSFSRKVYEANKEKGFHDSILPDKHHLCLIVSELIEAVEADRKGIRADLIRFNYYMVENHVSDSDPAFPEYFRLYIKDSVEDELADAVIRLFDFAGARNYDLSDIASAADRHISTLFTESIWNIIFELTACQEEEAVFCAISKIEDLCNRMFVDLWKHVELKIKYNKTRPYRHDKLY